MLPRKDCEECVHEADNYNDPEQMRMFLALFLPEFFESVEKAANRDFFF